jgi:alkylation response protein AidB-like acyl-CoA dehydrogenase
VWAARGPEPVVLDRHHLRGTVPWCSGATVADHALVAADDARRGAPALVLVDLHAEGVTICQPSWTSPAFAETDTRAVAFDLELTDDQVIGRDGWYLTRAGFWHGAIGVAACWFGCSEGLLRRVRASWRHEPHALAHRGAIDALTWSLRAALATAAAEIDAAPLDAAAAHRRALRVRHLVDVGVGEITTRVERALGPAPMAMGDDVHLVIAECDLYRRQCHAERDLEQLGRLALGAGDEL